MNECLTDEQLEQYTADEISGEERERFEAHINLCSECRARVEGHREKEALLENVRAVYESHGSLASIGPSTGRLRIGGYEILEEIHRGGQGVVYKAVQQSTDRVVAVKLLHGGAFASEAARKRLEREIRLAAKLQYPNIVVVHDSGVTDGCPYVVMDYIPGLPITSYAVARGLAIAERLRLFTKVCYAVEYAHQHGVLHRDLKPSNILVTEEGEPVIVDFGLAWPVQPDEADSSVTAISSPGQIVGTLAYLSPEQATGDPRQMDERTDVYALGVLVYELLTGTRPPPVLADTPSAGISPGPTRSRPLAPSQAFVGLDRRLDNIVLKALEPDKKRRYRSAGDFAVVIRTYLEQPGGSALSSRYRILLGVGVAVLLLSGLAITGQWLRTGHALREALLRPPLPADPPRYPHGDEIYSIAKTWPGDYHGRVDTRLAWDDFEDYRFGQNPPLVNLDSENPFDRGTKPPFWEHFEGVNVPGSEGLSNLYITGFWRSGGQRALRARTGIWRSARVSTLNIWKYVENADRLYWQCWLHLHGTPEDWAMVGFVADYPRLKTPTNWAHLWTNNVTFDINGRLMWGAHTPDGTDEQLGTWPQGRELACLLRVELDFEHEKGFVWLNGKCVGEDLPITAKHFELQAVPRHRFRLERWGFVAPGVSNQRRYDPLYLDIDDLEFGTWEYGESASQPATEPSSP